MWDCEYASAPFCSVDLPSWLLARSITARHDMFKKCPKSAGNSGRLEREVRRASSCRAHLYIHGEWSFALLLPCAGTGHAGWSDGHRLRDACAHCVGEGRPRGVQPVSDTTENAVRWVGQQHVWECARVHGVPNSLLRLHQKYTRYMNSLSWNSFSVMLSIIVCVPHSHHHPDCRVICTCEYRPYCVVLSAVSLLYVIMAALT